ncbi:TetR/AcrR family transcriptional regulator C-terminal ligand-binding domain-containing protein [Nocardia vinacea]|uniref:TetR/AcrR family transcriptional regulator C-terminal ligand-binding domain-containing protein n=1 Tax=Nocardia vinacea TaxID=96468 RepID=A0ABZ1YX02_9NOCA|nr:TetR/AcrR family transcriptional regulator C-terminal ligand-binding domain-containing protein [Nocardia vinacea]
MPDKFSVPQVADTPDIVTSVRNAVLSEIMNGTPVHAVSVAAVARLAGIHETSVYRRWKTRERMILDALTTRSEASLVVPDHGSLREDLTDLMKQACDYLGSPVGRSLLQMSVTAADYPAASEARRQYFETRLRAMEPVVERAITRGEVQSGIAAIDVLEPLFATIQMRVILTGRPITPDLPEKLVSVVVNGVLSES